MSKKYFKVSKRDCFKVIYTGWFSWKKIKKEHGCLNILWEGWITHHSRWSLTASACVARDNDHSLSVHWCLRSVLPSFCCQFSSFMGPDGHFYISLLKCVTLNSYFIYITPPKSCVRSVLSFLVKVGEVGGPGTRVARSGCPSLVRNA